MAEEEIIEVDDVVWPTTDPPTPPQPIRSPDNQLTPIFHEEWDEDVADIVSPVFL